MDRLCDLQIMSTSIEIVVSPPPESVSQIVWFHKLLTHIPDCTPLKSVRLTLQRPKLLACCVPSRSWLGRPGVDGAGSEWAKMAFLTRSGVDGAGSEWAKMAFLTRSGVDGAGSEWAKMAFLIRSGDTC